MIYNSISPFRPNPEANIKVMWLVDKNFHDTSSGWKISFTHNHNPQSQPPLEMSSSADIHMKIEAACAKREQDRLAAETEEAEMLRDMEEWQEEEKRMEEVRKAMEIERWEAEWNQRRIQKEKQRAEKWRQQEKDEDVPVILKWARRDDEWWTTSRGIGKQDWGLLELQVLQYQLWARVVSVLFWFSYPFVNNVVGLVITHRVIGASLRRNSVRQWNRDRRNGSGSEVRKGLG